MKEQKHGAIMRRNAFYVIGCFVLSALCVVGCNTAQIINIDPAKQKAQDEAVKIRAEVEKRLKNNDIKGAEAFLMNEVLVGNSAADRELGRVRLLLLLDKVLDFQWAELKKNLEKNYNRVKKCATVKEVQDGIAYFEKLSDNPIQVAKLPFWMQDANKEFSNKYEEKCNKINAAYNTLKDNYTAKLQEYLLLLEKRDFQLACNQLLEKVRATLVKNDYVSARKLLNETPDTITERFRPAMLAFRIGVLNTFVNPLQCQFVLADIDKKVKEFIANKKYKEGIKFLEAYKIEGTENDLLLGLLKAVSEQYGYDYCCGSEELEKFFADHAEELQKLLDVREGAWVHPEDGKLEKAIQKLEGEMKNEIPNEIAVREFINNLRDYLCKRNMATAALKEILGNKKAADIIALSNLGLEKAVNTLKANYTIKLQEYLLLLENRDFQLACNQLLEKVRATLIKNDYVSARKLLSETPDTITERFRPAMLAFRIGVLNTFVNPLQCQFVLADIDKKVKEFITNKKYEDGIKFLEAYKIEGTENDLLLGLLKAVSEQYGYDYCCGIEELEKFFAYHAEELQKLLDVREGAWVHPEDGKLEKAIQKLEGEMKNEIPNEISVREFINNLRVYICNRNMTTAALKEILGNKKATNIIALSSLNLEKAVKERVATKIAVLKLQASIQRPVGKIKTDGINFQDEIYNAEKQAKEKGIEKGLLLCEYARLMRILSEDTDGVDKVDKQVILAGAIVLARPKVARWALDAGGDFSKPLPFVKSSSLVLAFETSDTEMIAWVLENNANINIAQDGIVASKVATVMNRCDFIDIVFNAGFKPTKEQSKEMLNFACAKGRDVIFEKYVSKGFEPTLDDFVSAVEAGCLPIVRFFVEKKFYDVNNVRIVNAVIENDKKNYQKVKESEKMVHNLVNFFAEEKFSDEKSTKIVNAVIESEKKTKEKEVFEKTAHEVVKKYLVDRGMQLPSKQAEEKYHKAAK